jgi:hypothetical protein
MNKVLIFYFFACAMMFVCLGAVFTIIDIGQYLGISNESRNTEQRTDPMPEAPPFTLEEFRDEQWKPSREIAPRFKPPKHIYGYMYRVSAPVLLYNDLDFENAYIETLDTGGIFKLENTILQTDKSWVYFVQVSNGRRNYNMYMREEQVPATEYYGQSPPQARIKIHEDISRNLELRAAQHVTELQNAYDVALASYRVAETERNPKNPIVENIKSAISGLSSIDSSGVLTAVIAAAVITLIIAFTLGSFTWLRNTRAWESDISIDDIAGNERGADYFEQEEEEGEDGDLNVETNQSSKSHDMFS